MVQNKIIKTIENTGPKSFFERIRKNPKFEMSNKAVIDSERRLAEYVFIVADDSIQN